ncbi:MAG TPA: DUF2892 domain-containing protein [Spirochaetota bacterium]|nr:DUF2892 domain-containing protein [Spirochaetota bacterium]HPI88992.1 DUF2892 domain-containing protein [Spirochaetota bacterium]HPR47479.1 DUF2892 domain-containing protein [Spirochaetota bacterium]
MTRNMGLIDRIIRAVLALVVAVLYFTGLITGTAALILGIVALILMITSALGYCPLYVPLGINTCKK